MPAPNGPRASFTTGRNRRTVQNIASKGGNIYTALQRDRQTGIGGALNKAPKPAVKPQAFTPSASISKLKEINARSSANLHTTPTKLPSATKVESKDSPWTGLMQQTGQANVTAMALLAKAAMKNKGAAPTGQADGRLQEIAQRMAARRYGWNGGQWAALRELVMRESSWNPKADNPESTAYGLFQFLDSTRQNYGLALNAPARKQIIAGLKYIADRYGSPKKALRFHDRNNWY